MALRREAMRKGIQVQLSKLDDPNNPLDKIACVAYRLPHKSVQKGGKSWLLYQEDIARRSDIAGWGFAVRELKPDASYLAKLEPLLLKLPADSVALELTQGSVGLYWHERGESGDIETIYQVLTELQLF